MIRRLLIGDKEGYLELLAQLSIVGKISDSKWFLIFQEIEHKGNIEIYVLVAMPDKQSSDGNLNEEILLAAGTLMIEQKVIHEGGKVGHIEDVVVAKKARGLGLGKQIVDHLVARAKELGAYKVILDTKEETTGFYTKSGFYQHEVQMRIDLR